MVKRVGTIRLNHPYPSTRKDKKLMVYVKNRRTKRINIIHFGQRGYKHNYSRRARMRYLKRSAGIKNKNGRLTKDNRYSANYWARRILWKAR
jgi:hypothetical protein